MGDIRYWAWALFVAAWALALIFFGVGLSLTGAKLIALRRAGRAIIALSVGAAFAIGGYAGYYVIQW